MYVGALWFGVMDGAIVDPPGLNRNPIIEGNTLIVTCTSNSSGTPNITLQVNGQAATGFTSSVSGQTVNFTMESVSRSLQGGQISCMDISDSTSSGVVTLVVYCELSSPTEHRVLMYGVNYWVDVCCNVVCSDYWVEVCCNVVCCDYWVEVCCNVVCCDYWVEGQNCGGNSILYSYEHSRWECCYCWLEISDK